MFDLMPFERRERSLNRFFDDFENSFAKEFFGDSLTAFKTDVIDKGDHFELDAELPGFAKEDIHLDVENNRLTVQASHTEDKEEKEKKYVRRERSYGSYVRSFDISNIKADEITACYENGVLKIHLPKQAEVTPPSRRIEIR